MINDQDLIFTCVTGAQQNTMQSVLEVMQYMWNNTTATAAFNLKASRTNWVIIIGPPSFVSSNIFNEKYFPVILISC